MKGNQIKFSKAEIEKLSKFFEVLVEIDRKAKIVRKHKSYEQKFYRSITKGY